MNLFLLSGQWGASIGQMYRVASLVLVHASVGVRSRRALGQRRRVLVGQPRGRQIYCRASQPPDAHVRLHRVGAVQRLFRRGRCQRQKVGKFAGTFSRIAAGQNGRKKSAKQIGTVNGRPGKFGRIHMIWLKCNFVPQPSRLNEYWPFQLSDFIAYEMSKEYLCLSSCLNHTLKSYFIAHVV